MRYEISLFDWHEKEERRRCDLLMTCSALEVIQSTMIDTVQGPLGNGTGATSVGDPSAGAGGRWDLTPLNAITTADQVGAGILTAVVLSGLTGCFYWMLV
jgi:mannan endo-1,6-alpha-mannosidase